MAVVQDAAMTPDELQEAMFLLGPWLIGSLVDIFIQGVLLSQFNRYFHWYKDDRVGTRIAVVGLAVLTTLKSAQSIALIWIMFILHFKDLSGAILLNYTAWWQTGNSQMVASIGLYVQIFFCHRLWVVSQKSRARPGLLTFISIILLFAYVSICLATYYISQGAAAGPKIALWFAAHLSAVFAGDMLITLSTAYFLLKTKKEVLPQTVGIISALVRLTFQTAAPAAVCALFNLVFSQVYSGSNKLISTGFNQVLPKLYAFSMMWTLNARLNIRQGMKPELRLSQPSLGNKLTNRRPEPGVGMELAGYGRGAVQVRTETEVTQHVDFKPRTDDSKSNLDFKTEV